MAWKQRTLGTMTAFVRGEAPWIILVHGFAGAPWDWCRILTLLGAKVPVALIELPGHGPNRRVFPTDWKQASDDLARWLKFSQLAVGYSMGGRLLVAALSRDAGAQEGSLDRCPPGLSEPERKKRQSWGSSAGPTSQVGVACRVSTSMEFASHFRTVLSR